ncbi:hypothetical protein ABID19_001728 [Mesorhizobium robiniae]|uniref:Propionyl-coenzyme A carboxylase alpha polypeptide n=1 Tax=Mesorhizobium robiniae TaxID=559315 RepID=A0ABV2GKA0_9HYPH
MRSVAVKCGPPQLGFLAPQSGGEEPRSCKALGLHPVILKKSTKALSAGRIWRRLG